VTSPPTPRRPEALRGVFAEDFPDLRRARDDLHLRLQHVRFRDAIARLSEETSAETRREQAGADPAKAACTIGGRGLNAEEWALHIPELPYRSTC
jgi:hypothetical protein